MPFKSVRQRVWLQINEPEVYKKWKAKYGLKIVKSLKKKNGNKDRKRNKRKKIKG